MTIKKGNVFWLCIAVFYIIIVPFIIYDDYNRGVISDIIFDITLLIAAIFIAYKEHKAISRIPHLR